VVTWPNGSETSQNKYLDSAGAVGFRASICESVVTGRSAGVVWFGAHDGYLGGGASSRHLRARLNLLSAKKTRAYSSIRKSISKKRFETEVVQTRRDCDIIIGVTLRP
jgi:hypothetical protein